MSRGTHESCTSSGTRQPFVAETGFPRAMDDKFGAIPGTEASANHAPPPEENMQAKREVNPINYGSQPRTSPRKIWFSKPTRLLQSTWVSRNNAAKRLRAPLRTRKKHFVGQRMALRMRRRLKAESEGLSGPVDQRLKDGFLLHPRRLLRSSTGCLVLHNQDLDRTRYSRKLWIGNFPTGCTNTKKAAYSSL